MCYMTLTKNVFSFLAFGELLFLSLARLSNRHLLMYVNVVSANNNKPLSLI